jgi:hypothetical protein
MAAAAAASASSTKCLRLAARRMGVPARAASTAAFDSGGLRSAGAWRAGAFLAFRRGSAI